MEAPFSRFKYAFEGVGRGVVINRTEGGSFWAATLLAGVRMIGKVIRTYNPQGRRGFTTVSDKQIVVDDGKKAIAKPIIPSSSLNH